MLPVTVGNVSVVVIIIIVINDDSVDVTVVVGLVFPIPCPSLCQVSMGWWTEDQPYSVSWWTQSHWCMLVTITLSDVPRSNARHNQRSLSRLLHSVSCRQYLTAVEWGDCHCTVTVGNIVKRDECCKQGVLNNVWSLFLLFLSFYSFEYRSIFV
jgi:hypothetical protein